MTSVYEIRRKDGSVFMRSTDRNAVMKAWIGLPHEEWHSLYQDGQNISDVED